MKNRFVHRLLSVVLAVCAAGLVLGAFYALRRNCEAFGCPNDAALWSAWAAVCAVVGACGWRLRRGLVPGTRSRTITTAALLVQAATAVALAGYWWWLGGGAA